MDRGAGVTDECATGGGGGGGGGIFGTVLSSHFRRHSDGQALISPAAALNLSTLPVNVIATA